MQVDLTRPDLAKSIADQDDSGRCPSSQAAVERARSDEQVGRLTDDMRLLEEAQASIGKAKA